MLAPALNDSAQFWRTLFDATPIPTFIVDSDLRIMDTNQSAGQMLDGSREFVLRHRTGEVLHCVNSTVAPGGCGHSAACQRCVVRNCVGRAAAGQPLTRQRSRMELVGDHQVKALDILVTTAPMEFEGQHLVLLMLEDVTELIALRELIPICAQCKKIRDDQAYWQGIEQYLHKHLHLDFSHGICPACLKKLYPELYPESASVKAAGASVVRTNAA